MDTVLMAAIAAGLWALCLQAKYHRDEGAIGTFGSLAVLATGAFAVLIIIILVRP